MRLVQVAVRRKEKCVAGERLRQKAGSDLALLLKDDIERALRSTACAMAARRTGFASAPESETCERQQRDRRRDHHREPLLLRLAQLLRRNLDEIGAAHAQVEPLVANRPVAHNLDLIEERTALPATVVGGERERCHYSKLVN